MFTVPSITTNSCSHSVDVDHGVASLLNIASLGSIYGWQGRWQHAYVLVSSCNVNLAILVLLWTHVLDKILSCFCSFNNIYMMHIYGCACLVHVLSMLNWQKYERLAIWTLKHIILCSLIWKEKNVTSVNFSLPWINKQASVPAYTRISSSLT